MAINGKMRADDKPTSQAVDETQSAVLKDIAASFQLEEKCSPAVSEQLATLVNGVVRDRLPENVFADKLGLYNRPKNCEGLVSTKVNPLIW